MCGDLRRAIWSEIGHVNGAGGAFIMKCGLVTSPANVTGIETCPRLTGAWQTVDVMHTSIEKASIIPVHAGGFVQ